MIKKLYLAYADGSDPARNLALESAFLDNVLPDEMILYLWQNNNTVLIGRNQNVFTDIDLSSIERDEVSIMRRASGGGAIYHDSGNIVYSFITRDVDFSIERQVRIINEAVQSLGIPSEIRETHSIFVNGKKISGSAYYHRNGASIHQSSILVNCDLDKVADYLFRDKDELTRRGLASIQSRIGNLRETNPSVTVEDVARAIISSCEKTFNVKCELYTLPNQDLIEQKEFMFSSRIWTYKRQIEYNHFCENRFSWGTVRIEFQVENGRIENAAVWSDSAEPDIIDAIQLSLIDLPFNSGAIISELKYLEKSTERDDVIAMIREQTF